MRVGKKALSLVLALSMVIGSFYSTGVFAQTVESGQTWDSSFDSGVQDSAITYHITDSNFTNAKNYGDAEAFTINSQTGRVVIPQQVTCEDENNATFKDSNFNVTSVDSKAFDGVHATNITANVSGQQIEVQAVTTDENGDPVASDGGWVSLYKDSGEGTLYTVMAHAPESDYVFKGWSSTGVTDPTISDPMQSAVQVALGNLTAKFGPKSSPAETLDIVSGDLDGVYVDQGTSQQLAVQDHSGTYKWSVVSGMSNLDRSCEIPAGVTDSDVVSLTEQGVLTAKNPGRVLVEAKAADGTSYYGRITVQPVVAPDGKLDFKFKNGDSYKLYLGTSGSGASTTIEPLEGSPFPNGYAVSYASRSDENGVASVGTPMAGGVSVTPQKAGKTHLKFSADGYNDAYATITVIAKHLEVKYGGSVVEADPHRIYQVLLAGGEDDNQFKTEPLTVDANDGATPDVTWKSSDEKVATVDAKGVVTAVGEGLATISVSAADYTTASTYAVVRSASEAAFSYSYSKSGDYTPEESLYGESMPSSSSVIYQPYIENLGEQTGTLFAKIPVKYSDNSVSVFGIAHKNDNAFSYSSDNEEPITGASSEVSADGTLVSIPLNNVKNYNSLLICARAKSGSSIVSWQVFYHNENTPAPVFGHDGTYIFTSADGTKKFQFTDKGEFSWFSSSGKWVPIVNGQLVKDDYGFAYPSSLEFRIEDNMVTEIDTNFPNENPTKCWVDYQDETSSHSFNYEEEEEGGFVDYESSNSDGEHDVYYLNGVQPVAVSLDTQEFTLPVGGTVSLNATVKGSDNTKVTWTSDDNSVAKVDANGKVIALAAGDATITATSVADPTKYASADLTVINPGDYNQQIDDLNNSVNHLDPVNPTADDVNNAVSGLKNLGKSETIAALIKNDKIATATLAKLEDALEKVLGDSVTIGTDISADDAVPAGDRVTATPSISNLLLAAGCDADFEGPVQLFAKQHATSASGEILALSLNLLVDGREVEPAVPVTVTFAFPSSFTPDSGKTYTIRHDMENGGSETLAVSHIHYDAANGCYMGEFTTSSFSTFTVVATGNSTAPTHHNSGSSSSSGPVVVVTAPLNFKSDTIADITVNGTYQYRITSANGAVPVFVAGTPGVVTTQLVKTDGSDYFFKVTAVGQPGAKTGIYVNGVKVNVVTVGAAVSAVLSDTTAPFGIGSGKSYLIKLTAGSKPVLIVGNSSVFRVDFVKSSGDDYFFRITAVGKAGASSGFYINSGKVPVTIATVR